MSTGISSRHRSPAAATYSSRESPEIVRKALHGVVPRVDRPHELVHRLRRLANRADDSAVLIDCAGGFGKDRDVREPGPEIVVQIARDAGPLAIECRSRCSSSASRARARRSETVRTPRAVTSSSKPAPAPARDGAPTRTARRPAAWSPAARSRGRRVRGHHLERVVARGQSRVVGDAPGADVLPVVVDATQTNAESHAAAEPEN